MIAALFLALQTAVPAPPLPPAPSTLPVPQDWSAMPPLRLRRQSTGGTGVSAFVAAEVAAGRCAAAIRTSAGWALTVDLAVLATPAGKVRRVTPRAIACPTVEQYAAGLVLGTTRDNIDSVATTDTWYRTSMTFTWSG